MPDPADTNQGSANVTVTESGNDSVSQDPGSASEEVSSQSSAPRITYSVNKQDNELRQYASYNTIFTLACLTPEEINNPESTYRITDPQVTILRSGGGAKNKALTAYETSDKKVEYFIDNVEIQSIIAPTSSTRTSNATNITFEVTEPYSMGLFLQTLLIAAKNAQGETSDYLKAPYALIMDFVGWTDENAVTTTSVARRVIPIKFSNIEFDVDAGGSKYSITAFAWNEQSQSDSIQTINEDTNIKGTTVREVLQTGAYSLTNKINRKIQDGLQENTALVADEYVIIFPDSVANSSLTRVDAARTEARNNFATIFTDAENEQEDVIEASRSFKAISANSISGAVTSSGNAIGSSRMLLDALTEAATTPFSLPDFTLKEPEGDEDFAPYFDNGRIQIDKATGEFTFPGGSNIEKIIEEIVVLSQYGQEAATVINEDKEGNIPWFRVQTQTYIIPDEETLNTTGENPKVYVYMVVPYAVHSSVFAQARNQSVGIEERSSVAVKEYNYIYTGKNEDVLDFEIRFDAAFFNALSPNLGNTTGDDKTVTSRGSAQTERLQNVVGEGETAAQNETVPTIRESNQANSAAQEGGDSRSSAAIQAARQFNEAIVNSAVDMITLDLTIMGDPYFIADTGVGNYNSPQGSLPAITRDGTMNYQSREVDVVLNFRTPIDYNPDGGMDFPQDTLPVRQFSGLYRVNTVTNSISGNNFQQTLQMMRRPNQEREGTPGDVTPLEQERSSEGAVSGQGANQSSGNTNPAATGE